MEFAKTFEFLCVPFSTGSKNSAALDASKFSIGTESVILICICVCLIVRVILLVNYFMTFSGKVEISLLGNEHLIHCFEHPLR